MRIMLPPAVATMQNPRMARDDFTKAMVERLRSRVAHRCSNPECRVPTAAPGSNENSVTNVGEAAHIHAAAAGGPRYIASMTSAARKSIDNAIWLCTICSTKIDRDIDAYPAELLRHWKAIAEERARKELGKRPASPDDARREVTMALTGLPVTFVPTAIGNVHAASAEALESLDPRFMVETSYKNNITKFTLHAKENVAMSFQFAPEVAREWSQKLRDLIEHGVAAEVDAKGVRIEGSALLENVLATPEREGEAKYLLASNAKPSVLKLSLIEPSTNQVVSFDDIAGHTAFGRKSYTFTGSGFADVLHVSVRKSFRGGDQSNVFSFKMDFRRWEGRDVRELPYFESVARFFQLIAMGWQLDIGLKIEGRILLGAVVSFLSDSPEFSAPYTFLEYTRRARVVASHLDKCVTLQLPFPVSEDDHRRIADVADIVEKKMKFGRDRLTSNPTCVITANAGAANIRLLHAQQSPSVVSLPAQDDQPLIIFGQPLNLPPIEVYLDGVVPKILGDVSNVKEGDAVSIEWVPAHDFSCTVRFISEIAHGTGQT